MIAYYFNCDKEFNRVVIKVCYRFPFPCLVRNDMLYIFSETPWSDCK